MCNAPTCPALMCQRRPEKGGVAEVRVRMSRIAMFAEIPAVERTSSACVLVAIKIHSKTNAVGLYRINNKYGVAQLLTVMF